MRSINKLYCITAMLIIMASTVYYPTIVEASETLPDVFEEEEYANTEYDSEGQAIIEEEITDENAHEGNDGKDEKQKIAAPKLRSVKNCGKYLLVNWKPPKKSVDGIAIEVSEDKKFTKPEQTVMVVDREVNRAEIYDLKDQTKYYIRIRAYLQSGDEYQYSKWTEAKEIVFGNVVTAVTIKNNPRRLPVGKKFRLNAEITPDDLKGQNVTWTSETPETATVDPSGMVKAIHPGLAVITASCGEKKTSCKITVNIKGIITIIDDDGRKEFMKKMLPIIKEKKVSISTAVVPTWVDKKRKIMTWDEVAMCADSGAEVLCHTLKHHGPVETSKMKEGQIRDEYAKAQEMMQKHGYDGDILVYSRSTGKVPNAQKAASKVFKCGIHCSGYSVNDTGADMFFLKRYHLEPFLGSDPKSIKGWIDNTRKNGGWMIWSIHCATPSVNDKAMKNLRNLIDYARKQGVEIVSAREGYMRFTGN